MCGRAGGAKMTFLPFSLTGERPSPGFSCVAKAICLPPLRTVAALMPSPDKGEVASPDGEEVAADEDPGAGTEAAAVPAAEDAVFRAEAHVRTLGVSGRRGTNALAADCAAWTRIWDGARQ